MTAALAPIAGLPISEGVEAPRWGQLCMVPVASLGIDAAYQREIGRRGRALIQRIVGGFDPAAFGALIGQWEGDRFAVIDGQHRALAALHLGLRTVPALEVDGDPAALFGVLNRERVQLTAHQRWRAAAAAGDPDAVALKEAAEALDINILHTVNDADWRPGMLTCISAAMRVAKDEGRAVLEATLDLLVEAERETDDRYLLAAFVRGVGAVVGELFAADDGLGGALDRLAAAIAAEDAETRLERAKAQSGPNHIRLADAFRLAAMKEAA